MNNPNDCYLCEYEIEDVERVTLKVIVEDETGHGPSGETIDAPVHDRCREIWLSQIGEWCEAERPGDWESALEDYQGNADLTARQTAEFEAYVAWYEALAATSPSQG